MGGDGLHITSTAGTISTQDDALGPRRRGPRHAVLRAGDGQRVPPALGLAQPFQEAGVYLGTGLDSFVKIVAQAGAGGTWRIEMYRAPDPINSGKRTQVDLSGATNVTLSLVTNPVANVIVGKYSINGGPTQVLNYFPFPGLGAGAIGGVITSNSGGFDINNNPLTPAPPITATFNAFQVAADPTADITPPTVKATTPGNGSTQLPTTTNVIANFSERMDPTTLNPSTFVLQRAGVQIPVAEVDYATDPGGKTGTATLKPAAALAPGASYTAVITSNVRDRLGNPIVPVSWAFTTAAAGTTPGEVAPAQPGKGAGGAAGGANALTAKLKFTAKVKVGKKAKLTLTFSRKPNTTVTVQRKSGKRFVKVISQKVKTKVASISFAVGTKPGTLSYRASYKDGKVTRVTKTFTVRVVR